MGLDEIDEKIYKGDPHEMVGRFVTNAFGVKENVIMPKFDWDYLDWLVSIGADLDEMPSKRCDDEHPSMIPLGKALYQDTVVSTKPSSTEKKKGPSSSPLAPE